MDALDAEAVATWWADALGYRRLYDSSPYVVLGAESGGVRPRLVIQQVDDVAPGKSPVHLDLRVDDPDAEVDRLTGLGATVAWVVDETDDVLRRQGTSKWTTMTDPWGTLFCVCPARPDALDHDQTNEEMIESDDAS